MTRNQLEYKKQVTRLKRLSARAEKRGFIVPEGLVPKTMPKKVTKSKIDELKKLDAPSFYAKTKYKLPTGDVVSGTKGNEYIRSVQYLESIPTRDKYLDYLNKMYDKYGTDEFDIFGEYKAPPIVNIGEYDHGEFTSPETQGDYYYMEFLDRIYESMPDALYTLIVFALEDMMEQGVSRSDLGMALSKMPSDIIDYFSVYGIDSGQGIRNFNSDVINHLPISDKTKAKLDSMIDDYTVS